jgi:hypothetical protein
MFCSTFLVSQRTANDSNAGQHFVLRERLGNPFFSNNIIKTLYIFKIVSRTTTGLKFRTQASVKWDERSARALSDEFTLLALLTCQESFIVKLWQSKSSRVSLQFLVFSVLPLVIPRLSIDMRAFVRTLKV